MKRVGRRTGLYNVNTACIEMKRKVIIVGATSGLGRGIAETYISCGWTVGVAGRRENLLQEVVATAGAAPAYYAVCDVTDPVTAVPALQALVEQLGGMDLLVMSAGVGRQNPDLDYAVELPMLRTNVTGWTAIVDWAYRYFVERGGGQLAAISSIAALRGLAPAPAYSATKAFQAHYLEALRQRALASGLPLSVTDIRPGFVDTPLLADPRQFFWVLPPDKAVRAIVRAIDRRRGVAILTRRWRWLAPVMRVAPTWLLARILGGRR